MIRKFLDYFSQVVEEFKKIKYPERKEVIAMSVSVLLAVFFVGLFCLLADTLFIKFINLIIL